MVNSWLSSDFYSHGFLVPFISGYFIWIKRKQITERKPSPIGYLFLVAALALYAVSLARDIRLLGPLSLVIAVYGLVLSIRGIHTAKVLAFPLAFLLFMIPFGFVQNLAYSLQATSVQWSAWIGQLAGLPITTSGTEIYMGNVIFTVGLVCSGIDTLVALMALAAVYAFILKGSMIKRSILFIIAFPLAVAANVLRIFSIILVTHFVNVEVATGWYHDISSAIFFFISFGILALIAWAMRCRINYELFGKH
jgi:exosortase